MFWLMILCGESEIARHGVVIGGAWLGCPALVGYLASDSCLSGSYGLRWLAGVACWVALAACWRLAGDLSGWLLLLGDGIAVAG